MKPNSVQALARAVGGRVARSGKTQRFGGITADSRTVRPGDAFFCLSGEAEDGHRYAPHASARGAAVIIAKAGHPLPPIPGHACVVRVGDPLEAMRRWASACRDVLKCPVVGVTGSNGKTTVKEMIGSILSAAAGGEDRVLKSAGNHNTDIGLAMTLAAARPDHRFAVLEMAMRGPGQIRRLTEVGRPDVGVITSIGPAHLELLGSVARIARAKAEIFEKVKSGGSAVYPHDESRRLSRYLRHIPPANRWSFGRAAGSRVRILEIASGSDSTRVSLAFGKESHGVRLPLLGEHHASNAACAAAAALALGIEWRWIRQGLEKLRVPEMRGTLHTVRGRTLLNDCYNANPASMEAGLRALIAAARGRKTYAVLGDMLELGKEAKTYHAKIGRIAARAGISGIAVTGSYARSVASAARAAGCRRVAVELSAESAAGRAAAWSRPGDWILVKASRGSRLEKAFNELLRIFSNTPGSEDPRA